MFYSEWIFSLVVQVLLNLNIHSNVLTVKPFKETEVPWFFDVEFVSKQIKDEFKEYLDKNGIETRDFYPALSSQKYLDEYKSDNLEYSENIYNRLLWLPSGNNISEEQLSFICETVSKFKWI